MKLKVKAPVGGDTVYSLTLVCGILYIILCMYIILMIFIYENIKLLGLM